MSCPEKTCSYSLGDDFLAGVELLQSLCEDSTLLHVRNHPFTLECLVGTLEKDKTCGHITDKKKSKYPFRTILSLALQTS